MNARNLQRLMNESPAMRWGVVLLLSLTMAANYYFYDALDPLKEILTTELGWNSANFGFFHSTYSIPNTFLLMAVIGGVIADRMGIRLTGITFVGMMFIGSLITWYGGSETFLAGGPGYALMDSFWTDTPASLKMMSLGFLLFGLGAETSIVVISKAIVKWFRGKEVALALGVNLAIARGGSALAMILPPHLLEPNWVVNLELCAILLLLGFLAFIVYMFIDARFDKQLGERAGDLVEKEDPFRLRDIGELVTNPSFIFIVALCVTFYSAVFPFLKYAPDLMHNKYGMSLEESGTIVSLLPFGTIAFTPLFGAYIDKFGKGASLMILGSALLLGSHLLFALTSVTPWVPLVLLGIAFGLVPAAMWPALAKIVDDNRMGTAYGLTFSVQNLGLWGLPILIGMVLDGTNPGVASAKQVTGALADVREKAVKLVHPDEGAADEDVLIVRAGKAAQRLGDEQMDDVMKTLEASKFDGDKAAIAADLAAIRPAAAALAAAKTPAEARSAAKEIAAMKPSATPPLYDYKESVLMLAILGLFGFLFSFALKWADRRQGYGLDLPSTAPAPGTPGSAPSEA